jgi:hypothetical protein
VADGARWLLFTHTGRLALAIAYSIAAVASIVIYTVMRAPLYGAGQFVLTAFGLLWARWCLRRE